MARRAALNLVHDEFVVNQVTWASAAQLEQGGSVARRAALNPAVPAVAAKPQRKVKLLGWHVLLDNLQPINQIQVDPVYSEFVVAQVTWAWAKAHDEVMADLTHAQAEAVRLMRVQMVDVGRFRPGVGPAKKPTPPPSGIKMLCLDIQALVSDMAAASGRGQVTPAETADFVKRYGRYRDTMAELRRAFSEAEGSFDTVQQMILAQMQGDDE